MRDQPSSVWVITSGENPSNNVFIDSNIECRSDLLSDSWTAPGWIPLFHLENRCDDFLAGLS
jgi:hypothetical protein